MLAGDLATTRPRVGKRETTWRKCENRSSWQLCDKETCDPFPAHLLPITHVFPLQDLSVGLWQPFSVPQGSLLPIPGSQGLCPSYRASWPTSPFSFGLIHRVTQPVGTSYSAASVPLPVLFSLPESLHPSTSYSDASVFTTFPDPSPPPSSKLPPA